MKILKNTLLTLAIATLLATSLSAMDPAIPDEQVELVCKNGESILVARNHPLFKLSESLQVMINDLGGIDAVDGQIPLPHIDAETMIQLVNITGKTVQADDCLSYKQFQAMLYVIDFLDCPQEIITPCFMYCLGGLTQGEMEEFFDQCQGNRHLQMAVRLAYAYVHKENMDKLNCVGFVTKIAKKGYGVINGIDDKTGLISQDNLPLVLPLLEPLIGVPVTMLYLGYNNLTSLPNAIGNLVNLQGLGLSGNQLTTLPGSIGNLGSLRELLLYQNNLTTLPNSFDNLASLEVLTICNNPLTPDTKERLRAKFGHIRDFRI